MLVCNSVRFARDIKSTFIIRFENMNFICTLFNDTFLVTQTTLHRMTGL
jgi:hypothetical protein